MRCENHDVEIGVHPSAAASPGADNCRGDDVILPQCPPGKKAAQLHELLESVLRDDVLKSGRAPAGSGGGHSGGLEAELGTDSDQPECLR